MWVVRIRNCIIASQSQKKPLVFKKIYKKYEDKMSFTAHLEYLFHITCSECKFYWTYAAMQKNFNIEKREYHCPNCGHKGKIKLENEISI